MKVVIFGGSGFLGSHVADVFDDLGHEVTIYDIKRSPYLRDSQKMIVADIMDESKVNLAVKACDVVYNFAGIADVEQASTTPLDSVKFNVLGNTIILEACRKHNIKRFVFASSLYVYSKSGDFYRSTKQACELLIDNYHELFGLNYTILRYGSLYGPRADERNFIYKILKQALTENEIVREGDGEELREYIHVLDAAKNSVEILSDEFANQHVVITGNQQTRVKDLLFMIREMLDNRINVKFTAPSKSSHYEITPYSFTPKLGKRLNPATYLDLSQGILDMVYRLHREVHPAQMQDRVTVNNKG